MKTHAVMVFSLGSGGKPTVKCFWWASKSEQAYKHNHQAKYRTIHEVELKNIEQFILWSKSAGLTERAYVFLLTVPFYHKLAFRSLPSPVPPLSCGACLKSYGWDPSSVDLLPSHRAPPVNSWQWCLSHAAEYPNPFPCKKTHNTLDSIQNKTTL